MQDNMQSKRNLWKLSTAILLVAVLLSSSALYVVAQSFSAPNVYLQDLPSSATYTIKTDGTYTWAIRYDGYIAFSGTDAATVIQSALNALGSEICQGGGIVVFHPGLYEITQSIDIFRPETVLKGIGLRAPEFRQADGANLPYMFRTVTAGTRFVNLFLNGNKDGNPVVETDGIRIETAGMDISVEKCWIGYFRGSGVNAVDATWLFDMHNSAIEFNGFGLKMRQPLCFTVHNNFFVGQDDRSILLTGLNDTDARLGGIIEGNTFTRSVSYDIFLQDMLRVVITGNIFTGKSTVLGSYTVWVFNTGRDITVQGNIFDGQDNVKKAIIVDAPVTAVLIQGNTFRGFTETPWVWDLSNVAKILDNIGFVTENSGTATNATATTFSITHGLAGTPTWVGASFNTTAVTGWSWTSTSTTITVTIAGASLPESIRIYWDAKYVP